MMVCISPKHRRLAAAVCIVMLFLTVVLRSNHGLETTLDLTPPGIQPLTARSLQQALMEVRPQGRV